MMQRMKAVWLLCIIALCASASAKDQPKYPPLPEKVRAAKTICLENQTTYSDVFNHLYAPLSEWGRWKIVGEPSAADLRLVLTRTAPTPSGKNRRINPWWFLVLTEPNSDVPILYISCDIAIASSKGAARSLVKRLRERIDKAVQ
jgi:hypothetical protein